MCYDWYNGWYNSYVGVMLLCIFIFLSSLNPCNPNLKWRITFRPKIPRGLCPRGGGGEMGGPMTTLHSMKSHLLASRFQFPTLRWVSGLTFRVLAFSPTSEMGLGFRFHLNSRVSLFGYAILSFLFHILYSVLSPKSIFESFNVFPKHFSKLLKNFPILFVSKVDVYSGELTFNCVIEEIMSNHVFPTSKFMSIYVSLNVGRLCRWLYDYLTDYKNYGKDKND